MIDLSAHGRGPGGVNWDMIEQRTESRLGAAPRCLIAAAIVLAAFFSATPMSFADQLALSVERSPRQTIVLTQGFSTTIHGERPFGKVSITDPDVVDLVLRTDKSAVLIPQRLGRTNIDFLDDHGNLMGSMDVRVVRQGINDRVVIYNRPSLGAYSTFHCGANGCEHFEEMPAKEEALTPGAAQGRIPLGIPQ
jgi:hypothetical protein